MGVFLLEAGWEALVFGHFSQPLFGTLSLLLYSPPWLILVPLLLVRQVLTSIFVTLTVPSYFLLVAMIEVIPPKRFFSLTRRQVLTSASVTSTVPSYFLLVAMIEVTSPKRLFSLT